MRYSVVPSPVGPLLLAADQAGLRLIEFDSPRHPVRRDNDWQRADDDALLRDTRAQLDDYFAGTRRTFDLPLAPSGTAFQLEVWQELRAIPYGETISYAQLATRI